MKTRYFLILCLGLFEADLFAHEQIVHQEITANAEASAYANSSAYAGFINTISSDRSRSGPIGAIQSMVAGSFDEDYDAKLDPVGGNRSYNHFYDPLGPTNSYGKGLSDAPFVGRLFIGKDSLTWASVSNGLGHDFISAIGVGSNVGTSNIWSWQNARGYEWLGLTATNQLGRQTNLDNMFRAVGQVMHLLEDASQPQHVRNEQHVFPTNTWVWRNFDPFISPIEEYGKNNFTNLNYGNGSMLNWTNAGFTKLEDFWDRHFYAPGSATVLQDAETGGAQLGLAEWCNGNFLGDRHLFPEYYSTGDIAYYPYPSRDHSTDYNTVKTNLLSGLHPLVLKNGQTGNGIYLHKTTDGVNIQYLSRVNYLGAKLPNANLKGVPYCTIRDDNVLSNYHNIFIPKAVQYSAGLLDYYFRGNISTSLTQDTNTLEYIFGVTNTSGFGQDFGGGNFYLVSEDSRGVRTIVQTNALSGTLPNGSSLTITNSGPITNKMLVIYRGNIGVTNSTNALDPVDAGIGLAAKYAATCDCTGSPTSISSLVWTFTNPGSYYSTTTGSGSGNSGSISVSMTDGSMGNKVSEGGVFSSFCNPTSQDITIQISANLSWDYDDLWDGSPGNEDGVFCNVGFANTSIGVDTDVEPMTSGSSSVSGVGTMTIPAGSVASLGCTEDSRLFTVFGSTITFSITFTVSVVP